MRANFTNGLMFGSGILLVIVVGIAVAVAADILTVDKDGTIRLRVSDTGKVTLNTSETAQGDLRFASRTIDPTAPLAGDLWYNNTDRVVKYADGGMTKPLAEMTNATLALYVDDAAGNDNNNGLTSGTAVKTIQKAVNLVPTVVRHAVTINVAAGTYRTGWTTVGSTTVMAYVADKTVTDGGSITFKGSTTQAGAVNYRVTGSDSGADTTALRNVGFLVSGVKNVHIDGLLCNYFTANGVAYQYYASGNPNNTICDNNTSAGIAYVWHSEGSPNNCQANSNGSAGITYSGQCIGNPNTCTANSNTNYGFVVSANSRVGLYTCTANSNVYGFLIQVGSTVYVSSCTANSNTSIGFCIQNMAQAYFTACTANSNSSVGFTITSASVAYLSTCTANSNSSHGIYVVYSSSCSSSGCFTSLNGGYGVYYGLNSVGAPTNCTSPAGNNTSGGLRADYGSRVDYTDPMPNANNRTADATSQVW